MPQDQNTGGFYLALIKKNKHVNFHPNKSSEPQKETAEEEEKKLEEKETQKVKLNESLKLKKPDNLLSEYYPFAETHKEKWEAIKEMYGFDDVSLY